MVYYIDVGKGGIQCQGSLTSPFVLLRGLEVRAVHVHGAEKG